MNPSFGFKPGMVIYQVYLRSFKDSNNDGVGDLAGLTQKLSYIQSLGVNAVWVCLFYPSPMVDFGYDVTDYKNVDPLFGSLADFDLLISEAHKLGLLVITDLVLNHTSDQHPWFIESQSSKTSPKRDWYVWHDGKSDSTSPNNWLSVFGGSAWEYEPQTGQYYLHSFAKQQPDLNWDNDDVREAMKDIMQFWLDRGVDGFRLDSVDWLAKDVSLRDDPNNPAFQPGLDIPYDALLHVYSKRQYRLFKHLQDLTTFLATTHPSKFMILEARPHDQPDIAWYQQYYEHLDSAVAAPLNLLLVQKPWEVTAFRDVINNFQSILRFGDVPIYVLGNHDCNRVATRYGVRATAAIATLQLTLPGISVIYYGEEIGMRNSFIEKQNIVDIQGKSDPSGHRSRDPARTPMQWSNEPNAGFSKAKPWLPVNDDYLKINVELEINDPSSLLSIYRWLIGLRHRSPALKQGIYTALDLHHPDLFGFMRSYEQERIAVVVNFSQKDSAPIDLKGQMLFSTHGSSAKAAEIQPFEARIIYLA